MHIFFNFKVFSVVLDDSVQVVLADVLELQPNKLANLPWRVNVLRFSLRGLYYLKYFLKSVAVSCYERYLVSI